MVESFEPDLIIGSSMGGYCGLMLANYYNVECIAFNPAIHSRPIEPNLNETDKPDVEMNTYDMTTPDKNKVTPKRTSKKSKTITIDFGEDALQTENLEPQIELVKKPKAKPKARSGAKRKSKETFVNNQKSKEK